MIIILTILFGILRGFKEGMVMIKPYDEMYAIKHLESGVRCHKWFKYYHLISVFMLFAFAVLCFILSKDLPSIMYLIGLLLLLWMATEISYGYARWQRIITNYEHINFMDIFSIKLRGWEVYLLHILRIVVAITLLTGGTK